MKAKLLFGLCLHSSQFGLWKDTEAGAVQINTTCISLRIFKSQQCWFLAILKGDSVLVHTVGHWECLNGFAKP